MAKLAVDMGCAGFDIAGNEQDFPLAPHKKAIEYCASQGLGVTIHAAEWPNSDALVNLQVALDSGAKRIGHACAIQMMSERDQEKAVGYLLDTSAMVEICLTANVGSGKVNSYDVHPVRKYIEAGVPIALSSDNFTCGGNTSTGQATSTGELASLLSRQRCSGLDWLTDKQLSKICMDGFRHAFLQTKMAPNHLQNIEKEILDHVRQLSQMR